MIAQVQFVQCSSGYAYRRAIQIVKTLNFLGKPKFNPFNTIQTLPISDCDSPINTYTGLYKTLFNLLETTQITLE